jgi:prephenate dehydrogenase
MKDRPFRQLTVIGVGLLGGSVGLAAKAADARVRVVGVGRRRESLDKALAAGVIDRATLDVTEGVRGADLVVLATPLGAYDEHMVAMKKALSPKAVVTDVGSTKGLVVRMAEGVLGKGGPFVGSHPLAGGARKGPEFARADLFRDATCVITPTRHTPPALVRRVERFWRSLGGVTVRMSPAEHDNALARVSHLPHVLAALVVAIQGKRSVSLAGYAFLDITRIALGDPVLWREIIMTNRPAILSSIDAADEQLMVFRDLVELSDGPGIEKYLAEAKARRDAL